MKDIATENSVKKGKKKKYDQVDLEQISFIDTLKDNDILEELAQIDITNLTPMEAMNTLYRLQNKLKNRW